MLTGSDRKRLDLPHEPGEYVELQTPPHGAFDTAAEIKSRKAIEQAAALPAAILQGSMETARASERDPLEMYDKATLIEAAVTGWSYDEPVTPEAVARLDLKTAEIIFKDIIESNVITDTLGEEFAPVLDGQAPATAPGPAR